MNKSFNAVADARSDCLDQTRRLYRGVTNIAQRLDEQRSRALSVADIFTSSGEVLRAKLRDYCERLIFKDTIGHARKTEELLWRRGFYDVVAAAKKLRRGNTWSDNDKAYLSAHLAVGVGFYYHLILRLQLECDLELMGVIDFAYPRNKEGLSGRKQKSLQSKMQTEEVRQCAIRFIHRSLICLGDLARYRLDLDPYWDPEIATRYYKVAILINPNIGMPHNQLGTMSGNKKFGLDAVYHYTRCMLCPESFEGAEGNLKRMITTHSFSGKEEDPLRRCVARLLSLLQLWNSPAPNSDRINQVSQELLADIENCLTIDASRSNSKKEDDGDSVELYLQNFGDEEPYHLTDEMVFKIVVICFMTISRLQSTDSPEYRGVIAFALAILSQLLQTTIERLQESVIDMSSLNGEEYVTNDPQFIERIKEFKSEELKEEGNEMDNDEKQNLLNREDTFLDFNDNKKNLDNIKNNDLSNGEKKLKDKSKSLLTKLRRPRRRKNSSDSEGSDVDAATLESLSDELNSDISETEEDALSEGIVSSDDGLSEELSDTEGSKVDNEERATEVGYKTATTGNEDFILTGDEDGKDDALNANLSENENCDNRLAASKHDDKDSTTNSGSAMTLTTNMDSSSAYDESSGSTNTVAYVAQLKKQSLDPAEILNVLVGEGMLASIKICFDWLTINPDVVQSCAKSSKTLLKRITTLLNLINVDADVLLKSSNGGNLFQNLTSQNLSQFVDVAPLPEDVELKGLKVFEEAQKKLDWEFFRKFKINTREETLLRSTKLVKFGHLLCATEESGVTYDEATRLFVTSDVENSGILKTDCGKDSQQTEVDHPRGKLMRHMGRLWLKAEVRALESRLRSRLMSPYLVPDHEALAKHTPALKRLVYAKRFIVVIPSVVVSALDEVKRTSGKAREATRWLEGQLRRGSRFLRAQRPHERLPIPLVKGPRPKDKEAWLYFQIIECCHYLTNQTKVSLTSEAEAPVVTLLTGCSAEDQKTANFSPVGLAKSAGVNLEHIESFHTKWKASSKSHG